MAVDIELKRSAVPGKKPTTSTIGLGELAINTYDGKIYYKKKTGDVETILTIASSDEVYNIVNNYLSGGESGSSGSSGSTGGTGSAGIQGPPGPPGRDGRDGRDGLDGQDGLDGSSFPTWGIGEEPSYNKGDYVNYDNSIWISNVNNNYTTPGDEYIDEDGNVVEGWIKVGHILSVFGRNGKHIVAQVGDYNTAQVTEDPGYLYFTDARVSASPDVAANTAKRHNPVTLGTPNGLSLSTQVLSLGLSSATTPGALSAADWVIFNSKQNALGYTPEDAANKNQPGGYAGLDSSTKIPIALLPDSILGNVGFGGTYNGVVVTASSSYPELDGQPLPDPEDYEGVYFISTANYTNDSKNYEIGDWILSTGIIWEKVDNSDAVSTVFGRNGNVVANAGDYNTSQVTENAGYLYYTNARVKSYGDTQWSLLGHTHAWSEITSKPNTISGYGITDVWTKTQSDGRYIFNSTGIQTGASFNIDGRGRAGAMSIGNIDMGTFSVMGANTGTRVVGIAGMVGQGASLIHVIDNPTSNLDLLVLTPAGLLTVKSARVTTAPVAGDDVVRLSDLSGFGGGSVTSVTSFDANIVITNPTTTPVLTLASTITSNTSGNAATATSVLWTGVSGRPTSLSQFTNDSGYITSYTEVDTLQSVTDRGNGTSNTLIVNRPAASNWIGGNFGDDSTGNRVVVGSLAGIATIGGHNYNYTAWRDLLINSGGGNVGIGTTSALAKLDVNGNGSTGLIVKGGDMGSGSYIIKFQDFSGVDKFYINGEGNATFLANVTAPLFNGNLNGGITNDSSYMRFHWSGMSGQPSWLWGGNTPDHMYVYNPANFEVATAGVTRSLGEYVWAETTASTGYPLGISNSFIQSASGNFPSLNYGSLMTMRTYSGGGGTLQLYTPYSPSYGGNNIKVRFGNYDTSDWTSWKTIMNQGDTASNSSQWNGQSYDGTPSSIDTYLLGFSGGAWHPITAASVQSFLGLGSAAYKNESGTWSINITGTAGGVNWANVGDKPQPANWATKDTSAVVSYLTWNNYGSAHVIFDASKGIAPDGSSINNTTAANGWIPSYPTLMGWNGGSTYGLRVDRAGLADNSTLLGGYSYDSAASPSTVAVRNGSGYLYAAYFNMGAYTSIEGTTMGAVAGFNTSDGFIRPFSQAALQSFLGLGSGAYNDKTKLWSTSHSSDFYISNAWDGTYWVISSNHGAPTYVNRAGSASTTDTWGGNTFVGSASDVAPNYLAGYYPGAEVKYSTPTAVRSFLGLGLGGNYHQYQGFGTDANTVNEHTSSFTYGITLGTAPYNGALMHFGAGGYGAQFNAAYQTSTGLAFRTRNGDAGTWNPWRTIYHTGNIATMISDAGLLTAEVDTLATVTSRGAGTNVHSEFLGTLRVGGGSGTSYSSSDLELYRTGSSPTLGFHWAANVASTIRISSGGNFMFTDNPGTSYQGVETGALNVTGTASISGTASALSFTASSWFYSTGQTGWYNSTYGGGIYMNDTSYVRVYSGKAFWCDSTIRGGAIFNNSGYYGETYGNSGLVGLYNVARYQEVFSMGAGYRPLADGTGLSDMYGIAWTHTNAGGQSKVGLEHQALFTMSGITQTAIGKGIWTQGSITVAVEGTSLNGLVINASNGYGAYIANSGPTTGLYVANTGGARVFEFSNGSVRMYMSNSGDVVANGSISAYGGFFDLSDIRFKYIVEKKVDVSKLEAIAFTWKHTPDGKVHYGYSAQEVQKIMPDAVDTDENGTLSVNYTEVLVAKIEMLENKIEKLVKTIEILGGNS